MQDFSPSVPPPEDFKWNSPYQNLSEYFQDLTALIFIPYKVLLTMVSLWDKLRSLQKY